MITELHPHQKNAIALAAFRNALIVHPVGSGKTAIGVGAVREALSKVQHGIALVVCKKKAVIQWMNTIYEMMPSTVVHVCSTENPTPAVNLVRHDIVITHFEMLDRLEWLLDQDWTAVVIDEVHKIKNSTTKRSKAAKKLHAVRKVGLTATPLHKLPLDLFSVAQWLYPKDYRSKRKFTDTFVEMGTNKLGFPAPIGAKNLPLLGRLLAPFVDIKTNEDLFPDLQDPIIIDTPVAMTDQQNEWYWRLYNGTDIYVDGEDMVVLNGLARMMKCQQISSYPALLDLPHIPSGKLLWLKDFIEDLEEPAIIFSRFRQTAIDLSVEYDGSVCVGGMAYVDESIKAFKQGQTKLLFGTIDGLGESLDFPDVHTCVFLDVDPKTIAMQQAMGRINRPGSGVRALKKYYFLTSSITDEDALAGYRRNLDSATLVMQTLQSHQAFMKSHDSSNALP